MAEGGLAGELLGEGEEREAEASAGADPFAAALAMQGAGASPEAAAFLAAQKALTDLQIKHFDEERHLSIAAARRKRFSDRLKYGLQGLGAVVAAGVVAGLALMIWQAATDHELVIEPFSAPPDFAQRGLTGQVIAGHVLDRLAEMGRETNSQRAPNTYERGWGEDIKVEIPETGVSFQEVSRWLRGILGHETRITGDVVRTPQGLVLSVRMGAEDGALVRGTDATFDDMVERATEAIYERAEPYRYSVFLSQHERFDAAARLLSREARTGSDIERAWDLNVLGLLYRFTQGVRPGVPTLQQAIDLAPHLALPAGNLGMDEDDLSHPEAALAAFTLAYRNERRWPDHGGVRPDKLAPREMRDKGTMDLLTGDFLAAEPLFASLTQGGPNGAAGGLDFLWIRAALGAHDMHAARVAAATPDTTVVGAYGRDLQAAYMAIATVRIDTEAKAWSAVLADDARIADLVQRWPLLSDFRSAQSEPLMAYALAKLGRMPEARARIAATPLDCYDCVRAQGRIAALAKDWPDADRWFAEAVRQAPSIPFAYADWGAALLARGDTEGAIAKLRAAHKAGPHFADPLKLWGDALALQGKSSQAKAKYDEAFKVAPSWPALLQAREALGRG